MSTHRFSSFFLLSVLLSAAGLYATPEQEEDFRRRVQTIVASGSLVNLEDVYYHADSPPLMHSLVTDGVESMITRGIKIIRFHELFPVMATRSREGFDIGGEKYLPALEPYSMVTIEFENQIEGAPAGKSWIVGLSENRIYITGFVKMKN